MKKKGFVSLSSKIIKGISIPVVLVFVIAGVLILGNVRKQVNQLSETELVVTSESASYQVSEFFTTYLSEVEQIACNKNFEDAVEKTGTTTRVEELKEFHTIQSGLIKSASTDKENILAVWLAPFGVSEIVQSDGYISEEGWDVTSRPWYAVKSTKAPYLTAPYQDVSTGQTIITAAAPIIDEETGEVIGAAGIDITLDQVSRIMGQYSLGDTGSFLLSDAEGTVIYYPDPDIIQKSVSEIGLSDNMVNAITNNQTEFTEYTFNGVRMFGYVSMVGDTNWNVTSMLPASEFNRTVNRLAAFVAVIFLAGIAAIAVIVRMIALNMVKPLKSLTDAAQKIAAGDLDVSVQADSNDEIGALGDAISDTVVRLKDYIKYINEIEGVLGLIAEGDLRFELKQEYAGEFAVLKKGLLQIQDKLTGALKHINEVSGQVAEGAKQIAQVAANLASSSTEQSGSVEQLDQSIKYVSSLSEENRINADSASQSAQTAGRFLEDGNRKMEELTKTIEEISDTSQKIGGIMAIIEDISSQTNLLSLNASIEAARAGEAGRGFAVVANEVGTLANQTAGSSQETGELITAILESIKKGMQAAQDTTNTMLDVLGYAKEASEKMEGISAAVGKEAEAMGSVAEEVDQITSAVESNMAIAEESVAASEELASQAEALKELVGGFRI